MKWYKRDPDAWLGGVLLLTPEERGVYDTIIDLLYSRDGVLPNDDRDMARACGCGPQMWRRIRDELIAKGKVRIKTGNFLDANRVENELQSAGERIAKMTRLSQFAAEKRRTFKEASVPGAVHRARVTAAVDTTRIERKNYSESEDARGLVETGDNSASEAPAEPPEKAGGRASEQASELAPSAALQAIMQHKLRGR